MIRHLHKVRLATVLAEAPEIQATNRFLFVVAGRTTPPIVP